MYFDAGLKVGNYIYLIERLSRCLISIHIPSGKTRIENFLPWEYIGKIGMLSLHHNIFIYSPTIDYFLIYNCLNQQIKTIKLQEMEADEAGFYYSNVLIVQDDLIVLPYKGKGIKRYGIDGKLKYKDSQWCSSVARACGCNENLYKNIRMNSACIVENQLFFSLVYGNRNYLCRYELNQKEHLCNIIYHSEDRAIRGVYAYPKMVVFRRIFSDKTEIVLISLDANEQKTIMIDYPSRFEEDVYGNIHHLRVSFKDKILAIDGSNLKEYQQIYNFESSDVYIANGILFNAVRNEILIPDVDCIEEYSIEKTVREIKNCSFYQEGCRKLFSGKFVEEERYKFHNLIRYLIEFLPVIDGKSIIKNKSIGEVTWRTIQ